METKDPIYKGGSLFGWFTIFVNFLKESFKESTFKGQLRYLGLKVLTQFV